MSSVTQLGRSTATISVAQTAPIRIHHLTGSLCADESALARRLPDAVTEALQLCARPITDAVLFERALARDPALAAQLISIAGAGLFAPRATILGVRDAVLHLGLESIRDVLMLIVTNAMAPRAPGFEGLGETLRRRALAAGIASRLCARALRVESGHDFLVGLLHDVGETVLLQRCAEEDVLTPRLLDDPTDGPVIRDTLHHDHGRVGAAICRAWKLPPAVAEAAELHHDYRAGRRARLPAHLAAASDVLASYAVTSPPTADPTRHPVLSELALPPAVIASIAAEVVARLPAFAAAGSTAQAPR